MDLAVRHRRALVMGASKGLGRAIARVLAGEGATVAICARDAGRVSQAAAELGAIPFVADLSVPGGARKLVGEVQAKLGGIDILVVNTGGPSPAGFDQITDDAWRAGFEALWMSAVQAIRECLPGMRRQGWGRIMVVTSIAAREPLPRMMMSSSLRAGVHGMVNALSREVAADGITVNALMPGYTMTERIREAGIDEARITPLIPAGRFGRPEEFAALAAFLASENAGYITGQAIACDGGMLGSI